MRGGLRWALPLAALLPTSLAAQQLVGTLLRADSVTPAAHVLVEWRDGSGRAQRVLSDSRGRFVVTLPRPDSLRLRALRPGYQPQDWPATFVPAGQALQARFVLADRSVALAAVRVEGRGPCVGRADRVAWTLWEQARVAIQSASLAESDPLLRIEAVEFDGTVTGDDSVVVREASLRPSAGVRRRPAAMRDSIFRFGYVRRTSDTSYYESPTPDVLADDRFAERYCFAMVPPDSAPPGLHGVRFTPQRRPGPGIADVAGTLWIDRDGLLLRRIEYAYLNVPAHHRAPGLGGSLAYVVLPSGHWLLQAWVVRMPDPLTFGRAPRLWAQGRTVFGVFQDGVTLFADSSGAALAARRPAPGR